MILIFNDISILRQRDNTLICFFVFLVSQYENGKKILLFFIHDDDAL